METQENERKHINAIIGAYCPYSGYVFTGDTKYDNSEIGREKFVIYKIICGGGIIEPEHKNLFENFNIDRLRRSENPLIKIERELKRYFAAKRKEYMMRCRNPDRFAIKRK